LPQRSVQLYTGKRQSARVRANVHPTVKPLDLVRWLVKLVTPPGGLVLDPFTGSGTTGAAAVLEGRQFLGIEREPEYVDIGCARLTHWAHEAAREAA
jgi:site-specific DNA-methyltransferase (adenine-specific)